MSNREIETKKRLAGIAKLLNPVDVSTIVNGLYIAADKYEADAEAKKGKSVAKRLMDQCLDCRAIAKALDE